MTLLFVGLLGLAFVASERNRAEQKRYALRDQGRAASLLKTADIRYRTKVLSQTEEEAKARGRRAGCDASRRAPSGSTGTASC